MSLRMLPFLLAFPLSLAVTWAHAASGILPGRGPVRIQAEVVPWKAYRDREIVKQDFDYSCGASSLATILRYYYRLDVGEVDVLMNMDVSDNSASFADLKKAAETAWGLQAVGLSTDFESLKKLKVPAIAHLKVDGNDHFSVIRGVDEIGGVWLADPATGNRLYSARQFLKMWNTGDGEPPRGKILVVLPPRGDGSIRPAPGYFRSQGLAGGVRP